jgi:hypothetical protein
MLLPAVIRYMFGFKTGFDETFGSNFAFSSSLYIAILQINAHTRGFP